MEHLIYISIIASVPFFAGRALAQSASAEPTLWGIYGAHNRHDCPVNNRETAKEVIAISMMDLQPLNERYGITAIADIIIRVSNTLFSGLSRPQSLIIWKRGRLSSALPAGTI